MSQTTHIELNRKSLKRPDEFFKVIKHFFDNLAQHARALIIVIAVFLAISFGIGFWLSHSSETDSAARNALFLAQKKVQDKHQAIGGKSPELKVIDVDAEMAEAVSALKQVTEKFSGTRAAFEALVSLGDLYSEHGDHKKSATWYQSAISHAPSSFDKGLVFYALGYAHEGAKDYAASAQAFEKGLGLGEAGLKGELLLGLARVQALAGQKDAAKKTYDRVITELSSTEDSKKAEALKSQL